MNRTRIRKFAFTPLVAALALLSLAATPGVASAATLPAVATPATSGYGYDGQWPDAAGCAGDATTPSGEAVPIRHGNATTGWIELRYSPSCRTAWARVTSYYWGGAGEYAAVVRNSDGKAYTCDTYNWSSTLGAYSCYTRMVYDGGETSWTWGDAPNWYDGNTNYARTPSY